MMNIQGRDSDIKYNVCPSDRQLALRAKLHTGWSTGRSTPTALNSAERDVILGVIQRNELLESAERQRIGKIIERVEKIKQRAADCGPRNCRLCGQGFGLLSPSKIICEDCRKPVCSKCSIELHIKHGTNLRDVWLCQICLETREMWKKTGAWFFGDVPRHEAPQQNTEIRSSMPPQLCTQPERTRKLGIRVNDSSSDEDESNDDQNATTIDTRNINDRSHRKRNSLRLLSRMNSFRRQSNSTSNLSEDGYLYRKLSSLNLFGRQQSSTLTNCINNASQMDCSISMSTTESFNSRSIDSHRNRCGSDESSNYSMSEASSMTTEMPFNNSIPFQMSREPPLGWLELSILYTEIDHSLDCTILRARDLAAMDIICLPDPYARLNIITEFGQAKQKKWLQTKIIHKTRSPEFNETVRFFGVEPEELATSILYVVLLDEDKYGSDFLGTAKVELRPMIERGAHRMSVPLYTQDQHCLDASISNYTRGSILIGLCYNTRRRSLVVQVKRCTGLIVMDNNGFSDPFVKLQLKPDSHRNRKYKTSVKWRNLNPIFNEEFSFEARPSELDKQSLIITVWDKDLGKSNDFLGSLVIGHKSKGKRLSQWKNLLRAPDTFHEQWHYLAADQHPS